MRPSAVHLGGEGRGTCGGRGQAWPEGRGGPSCGALCDGGAEGPGLAGARGIRLDPRERSGPRAEEEGSWWVDWDGQT